MWAVSAGGTSSAYGQGITSVGSDKIAVTGYFWHRGTFGNIVLTSNGNIDTFVAMVSVSISLCVMN